MSSVAPIITSSGQFIYDESDYAKYSSHWTKDTLFTMTQESDFRIVKESRKRQYTNQSFVFSTRDIHVFSYGMCEVNYEQSSRLRATRRTGNHWLDKWRDLRKWRTRTKYVAELQEYMLQSSEMRTNYWNQFISYDIDTRGKFRTSYEFILGLHARWRCWTSIDNII